MVKISIADINAIFDHYRVRPKVSSTHKIRSKKTTTTTSHNTVISFEFSSRKYIFLFDEFAYDSEDYIKITLKTMISGTNIGLVANPSNPDTYGFCYKGKIVYLLTENIAHSRLDVLLSNQHPQYSRSQIKKLINSGVVKVNGTVAQQPSAKISFNSEMSIDAVEPVLTKTIDLEIIYIDENVLVVEKPAGMLSHSKGNINNEFTVADFFRHYSTYNQNSNRPGIIHRLDRDTSGVIIGARNYQSASYLQKQFANRTVKKSYYAVLDGIPKEQKAIIDVPITRNLSAPSSFKPSISGKNAVTFYQVINIVGNECLVFLQPSTGRTHQLRVHMKYINTPIKGDRLYGKKDLRLYLHAYSLELTLPSKKRMTFTSPLTSDFNNYVTKS